MINEFTLFNLSRCSPCRRGTRCFFCEYLVYFHLGNHADQTDAVDIVPFREPFIVMFEDIKERLESDSNSYTDSEIVTLFQDTTETLTQDCENCKHHAEIVAVSDFTNQVASKLDSMKGSNNFLSTALKDIEETIKLFKEVPDSLLTPIPRKV